ncbi:bifunctional aconitate hydratase 2/2-methylisocitrate dehydratase [Blochmannia endosymbiont of Polyrhachis (Hedomyrma) turneri]|uniref:bifunctional aconitate hydratase 2/2-methylisocitrate dehydratase n=1 Tax=Blochmannia endosymbiont of Polyrhachis (Hedomyrma) turneri TaxID=1505596 RepID=UPI00061A7F42|nr:bifunctional aconitate hydratase 2/2-methylisocitrate dehydratase [Blochmannia endosymbiont of Polyrhachis (Hedomyrma) turneri]AKC59734.1 aconitate hydratase 2 [Blochmannia endosymbiont of Polyrhachis (Hedomyrma) turneri]
MMQEYQKHIQEREKQGLVPKPMNVMQIKELIKLLENTPSLTNNTQYLLELLSNKVVPGVDETSYIKANFLTSIIYNTIHSKIISKKKAIELLGTMQGGYNIPPLIHLLDNHEFAPTAFKTLKKLLLIFNNFENITQRANNNNFYSIKTLKSWAHAEWFFSQPNIKEKITGTVFKVPGETNTDDLSPANDAWSRPDIPLHALTMLKYPRKGIIPDKPGYIGPIKQIQELKKKGFPLIYVGDIVGTGSSRKSAANSLIWFIGNDIPYIPNKKSGGILIANKIAPIFFNTLEDSGTLPIETNVSNIKHGDIIDIYPFRGEIWHHEHNILLTKFVLKHNSLLHEVRAGGRIMFIIGRDLTQRARQFVNLKKNDIFEKSNFSFLKNKTQNFTLAQKIIGQACGIPGVYPGQYCEPKITSIGSQDTTGPMTRDELKSLGCLNFSTDLFLQSFCHTAAYPQTIDIELHNTLPQFIIERGGIALKPGDGIIHSWLNHMLLPDTVGTGGDSHTRFPIGISFPAGSSLVAFAATTGIMPLNVPESVLVKFTGNIQPGITLRDLVHAIPHCATKNGLLTTNTQNKKNIFSGHILEIEGLPNLNIDQAFELTDSSAERSASACTIKLNPTVVINYLKSNITLLTWMINTGYQNKNSLKRRIASMINWLKKPYLLCADENSKYIETLHIDLSTINQPILCMPNDPDNTCTLSEISGHHVDEVFIGSCMTNIEHFRTLGKLLSKQLNPLPCRLWIAPPTKMDALQLTKEGYYDIFNKVGAKIEIPGCSLCMGNQLRVKDGATVISTSTRNFPNRLGKSANVYLASTEIATITAILGRIPNKKEYFQIIKNIISIHNAPFLNFSKLNEYI